MNMHSPSKIKALVFAIFTILFPSLLFAQMCTDGTILFESDLEEGGPVQISYTLINADTEELIQDGTSAFIEDPSESVEICLPPGCYALAVQGSPEELMSDFFFTGVTIGVESIDLDITYIEGSMVYEFCLLDQLNCPNEIEVNQSPNPCGPIVFTIPGYEDYSGIQWFTPDGVVNNGTGVLEYTPMYPGPQEVCAFLETPECPLGVELCAFYESNCDQSCEVILSYDLTDNGGIILYAEQFFGGVFPETYFEWIVDGEFTNNIGFVFETSFDDCEDHEICVLAWNSFCESDACIIVQTDGCEDNCPSEIEVNQSPNPCGPIVFTIPGYEDYSGIQWFTPDGVVNNGTGVLEYTPMYPGPQEVCAFLETPECPLGVELCAFYESNCDQSCEVFLSYDLTDNGGITVYAEQIFGGVFPETYYEWIVDGEFTNNIGFVFETSFDDCEDHEICVLAWNSFCESDACIIVQTDGCEDNCPSEIEVNQSPNPCGPFVFTIPGYEDYSGVQWFTPDGVVNNGTGVLEYTPMYPGPQEVCAFLETPECPLGVELCAFYESNCDQSCEVILSYDLTDNGGITLYAEQIFGGVFPETYFEWIVDGEFINNTDFVFETSFDDCEDHEICVFAWNSFCESDACITIQTDGCEESCPDEIWVGNNDCTYSFEVGSFQEGESATWYIGDQVFEGGHFIQYQFLESGIYDVCVDFSSDLCSGTEICTTIEVEACNNCDATFFCDVVEDQLFLSPINVNEDLVYTWFINDEYYTNEIFGVYQLMECGAYQVCLNVSDPQGDCDDWFCDVMVYDGCENDCPESIEYGNDGCNYWFELGSAWEEASVTWFIGGMVFEGAHYLELDNLGLTGPQTISAQLNNGACEGLQLTTVIDFSGDCGCSSDFEWGVSDNGVFHASPNDPLNQDIYYSWVIDGEWLAGSDYEIELPLECGVHEVCLYMESGFCLSNSCEEIFVECSNCELELTADMDNCSGYFTIENPEASEISWSTENGEVYTGNNVIIDFESESDGLQLVCVNAELPGCGVVDACITVETEFCEAACTLVTFAMDSYVNEGGPQAGFINITNELGESWFLSSEFGPNDFYFDGELCLPNGCYDVLIDTPNGTDNPDSFFSSVFVDGQELEYTYGPTWNGVLYEYGFALNSDCAQDECNLNIAVEQQEGSWYLFNAITDVWEQNVSWFVNDEFIASGQTFAYDFPEGNHELCAMIETPDCPEGVWSCMDIVVGEEEFCTPIAIQIVAGDVLLEDLWIDYSIESIFGEIGGEVYLSSECGETYIMACIPNACYELNLSVEEALLVPLLMNAFVDGPLSFEYTLDPESTEMNVAFGINTDCENSIDEVGEDQTLKVYPVPANENLNVVFPASSLGGEWQMINTTGQVVAMGKVEETGLHQFQLAAFAAGVYHFQVSYDENHQQKRLQTTWTIAR